MGGRDASADRRTGEREMSRKNMLMMLGLGVMLAVGGVARGAAAAQPSTDASPQHWTPQASAPQTAQPYTGQVESIKIDHCDLQPGTCEGSLVLAQAGGQEVTLAIPARTAIQRGEQRVYLEDLGVGNYITVQATLLATEPPQRLSLEGGVPRDGDRVGATMGERPVTLREATDE
jgi:hypothetical protein